VELHSAADGSPEGILQLSAWTPCQAQCHLQLAPRGSRLANHIEEGEQFMEAHLSGAGTCPRESLPLVTYRMSPVPSSVLPFHRSRKTNFTMSGCHANCQATLKITINSNVKVHAQAKQIFHEQGTHHKHPSN
jgi:hypothetical protein